MGMPGILFAKLNSNRVILTDRPTPNVETWTERIRDVCLMNQVQDRVTILPIIWGQFDYNLLNWSLRNESMDSIIASDCFYDPRDFDRVLATVRFLFDRHKCKRFITAYHERDENRNLQFLLKKWNFIAEEVSLESFINYQTFSEMLPDSSEQAIKDKYLEVMSSVKLFIMYNDLSRLTA